MVKTTSDSSDPLRISIQRSVASVVRSGLTLLVVLLRGDGSRTHPCSSAFNVLKGCWWMVFLWTFWTPWQAVATFIQLIQWKLRKLLQADVFIISYRPPQVLAICKIDFDTSLLHIFSSQIHADHADICPDVRVRMGLSENGVLYPKISWLKYHISYIFILSIMDIW